MYMFNFKMNEFSKYKYQTDDFFSKNIRNKNYDDLTEEEIRWLIDYIHELRRNYNNLLSDVREFLEEFKPVANFFAKLSKSNLPPKLK